MCNRSELWVVLHLILSTLVSFPLLRAKYQHVIKLIDGNLKAVHSSAPLSTQHQYCVSQTLTPIIFNPFHRAKIHIVMIAVPSWSEYNAPDQPPPCTPSGVPGLENLIWAT